MTDIYEQLQTEADVEAEKIRPTKEESSLYGAKWLTVEDLLTDDKGYSKFAVDSAKAGGGSSDLTIAKLTFTRRTSGDKSVSVPCLTIERDTNIVASATNCSMPDIAGYETTQIFDVILYKGKAILSPIDAMPPFSDISTSGNIQFDDTDAIFIITGDCSLTW